MGLSWMGEPLLPESSVRFGPQGVVSDPLLVALVAIVRGTVGTELVGLNLVEKRDLVSAVVRADGADLRLGIGGGDCIVLSREPWGGGLLLEV